MFFTLTLSNSYSVTTKQTKMKKATVFQLLQRVRENENLHGAFNHAELTNNELVQLLSSMSDYTLYYTVIGNCLMIFSKPS